MTRDIKQLLIVLGLTLVIGFLALHDLPYLASTRGRCMAQAQPSILIGEGPSFMTELACA